MHSNAAARVQRTLRTDVRAPTDSDPPTNRALHEKLHAAVAYSDAVTDDIIRHHLAPSIRIPWTPRRLHRQNHHHWHLPPLSPGRSKCLHGLAAKYLAELCVPVADVAGRRQLRSASRGLLNFPRYNMSNYGRRAFCFAGPYVWNSLPEHIRQSTAIAVFKRSLKTFLLQQISHLSH